MSLIEIFGVVFGLICVWLTVRQNIWCWPTGLVNVILFMIMFYHARLYADMGLQAVYIALSLYGWHQWLYGGPKKSKLPITRTGRKLWICLIIIGVNSTLLMGWSLSSYTNADLPYWDSTTTVMSLIAQWMLAKKILDNWLIWISADVLFVGIYFYKQLYLTGLLYVIFLILATSGYLLWRKDFIKQLRLKPA